MPGIAALELATARHRRGPPITCAQWQVAFDELPDGRIAVPAREANGTILFFAERLTRVQDLSSGLRQ